MEITSREEVHILGLFRDEDQAVRVQELVYGHLAGENDAEAFGPQTIVGEFDDETGSTGKLLIGATSLTLEETVRVIHDCGGLAIASHIDRERFGCLNDIGKSSTCFLLAEASLEEIAKALRNEDGRRIVSH
jgi:hypothetical protein